MLSILIALVSVLDAGKRPLVREFEFDVMELNHRYDENCNHCYDQIIFWQWNPAYRRHDVDAWMLTDDNKGPFIRKVGEAWVVSHMRDGKLVHIRSKVKIETWTSYDPERKNKELKDERFRRPVN